MFCKAIRLRSILRFLLRTTVLLCLILLTAVAGIFLFFQTDTGRAYLASRISDHLSSEPGFKATVEGLEGFLPFNIGVRRMVLADADGPWLTAKDIRIGWSPAALLRGRVSIGKVSVSAVNLDRMPKSARNRDSGRRASLLLPARLPAVTVDRVSVGELAVGRLVTGQAASFRFEGSLKSGEREHGAEASLTFERKDEGPGTRLSLALSSPLNPPAVKLRAEFHEDPDGWIASALRIENGGGIEFILEGDGVPAAWNGSLHGTVHRYGNLESSFAVRSEGEGFDIRGRGRAGDLPLRAQKPFLPDSVDWSFHIGFPPGGPVAVKSLRMEAAGTIAELNGSVEPEALRADLQITLLTKDGKPAEDAGIEGAVKMAEFGVQLQGNPREGSATGTVRGRLEQVQRISKHLLPFLGSRCAVSGGVELQAKSRLLVRDFKVESERLTFTAQADTDLTGKTGRVEWRFAVPRLHPIGADFGAAVSGDMEGGGTVEGPFSDPRFNANLRVSGFEFQGRKIGELVADVDVRGLMKEPRGNVRIDLRRDGQALQASSEFSLKNGRAALSSINLKAPGGGISGSLSFELDKPVPAGNLKGDFSDLSALGRLLGEPLGGRASVDLKLDPAPGGQAVKAAVKGFGISTKYGSVKTVSLSADLSGLPDAPSGHAELHLDEVQGHGVRLQSVDFKTSGDRRGMNFEGSASGKQDKKFSITARGTAVPAKDGFRVRLSAFQGSIGKSTLSLLAPAAFQRTADGFAVEDLTLGIGAGKGAGQLKVAGRLTSRDVSFTGQYDKVPLGLIRTFGGPPVKGQATGRIGLEGNPSGPSGSFALTVTDMFYPAVSRDEFRGAVLSCSGRYGSGRLAVDFDISRNGEKPFTGRLGIPVTISLAPAAFSIPPGGPVDGRVEARVDLASLTALFPMDGHKLTGTFSGTIELGGTVSSPVLGGHASLADGTYENFTFGTLLKNIRVEIAGKGNRIEVEEFEATDGEKGTVSAKGWVTVEAGNRFPLEVRASLSSARLIRRADAGVTADGNLSLSGPVNGLTLSGDIRLESAEYNIPKRRPTPVASLKVIEINGHEKPPPAHDAAPTESGETGEEQNPFALGLDVGINLPGKAFLRGEGLNSEWKGDFRVRGPAASPSLTGHLSVVRGTFQFLGQRFNLLQGTIQFDGASPPNPLLDVTAQVQANDIKANVILSGVVSSPEIRLESDPSLPPDEILSRILFKRSLSQINPAQALKIAAALGGLSGQGSALDFLERTRGFLGLDQFELRQPESGQNQVAVGIGKYLTDQVYVDVQKDVGSGGAAVAVQVEIAPNLTFGSKVGTDADKGIEINWKRDY